MKVYILIFILFLSVNVFGQSQEEIFFLDKLKNIETSLDNQKITKEDAIKKCKELTNSCNGEVRLCAVFNALSGHMFKERSDYDAASSFFKKSYRFRKKENEFLSTRWAMNELIDNEKNKGRIGKMYNYGKEWIIHTYTMPEKLESVHYIEKTKEGYFETEMGLLMRRIYPISYRGRGQAENWEDRRKYSLKLLRFYLDKFPEQKQFILGDTKEFTEYLVKDLLEKKEGKNAETYVRKILNILKSRTSGIEHTDFIRFYATLFRKNEEKYSRVRKTTEYEGVGIALIEEYVKKCQRIGRNDQVVFGCRYLAVRYKVLKEYNTSIQYLVTAIKQSKKYKLFDEIEKSFEGIRLIVKEIKANEKSIEGINSAKRWKDGYSLQGLSKDEVEKIDKILGTK